MEIFRHIEDWNFRVSEPILTMGNFDGIHLGHQALLRNVVQEAKAEKTRSAVLTFEPHPLRFLAPERAPRLILTHKDKMRLIESCGVDVVLIQTFNAAFANLRARDFVQRYLIEGLGVRKIWVGRDLGFGRRREGRVVDLIRWGAEGGFEVGIVEPIELGGLRVSSSRIREMIERGEVSEANRLLGRCHFISGRVVPGHRRGRHLGFPTANIVSRTEVVPRNGVYATFLQVGGRQWPSVTNIGVNPTFGSGPRTTETYVFDFQGDLYGQSVKLFIVEGIREEKKFSSPDLLVEQMKRDVRRAEEILQGIRPDEYMGLTR